MHDAFELDYFAATEEELVYVTTNDDTHRRLTAAFRAIAEQVRAEGWRLATDPVVRREARLRATGAAFRRVCDDASIDCIMIGLTDNIGDDRPLGDVEPLVRDGVAILKARPIESANAPIEFDLRTRCAYAWREDAFYTGDEMERNRKGAYDRGAADARRAMEESDDEPLANTCIHVASADGKSCTLCRVSLAKETTTTTASELAYATIYYIGDGFADDFMKKWSKKT